MVRKIESGEHNKLVTLYTRELGKIRVLAKSVKKNTSKQAGHLDLFNVVDFVAVPGKSYPIITQAQSSDNFLRIKSSFAKAMAGFFILESFHRLIYEHEQDVVLWNFLNAQLNKLEQVVSEKSALDALLADFKKELLGVLGYRSSFAPPSRSASDGHSKASEDKQSEEAIDYFLQSLSAQRFSSLSLLNSLYDSKSV